MRTFGSLVLVSVLSTFAATGHAGTGEVSAAAPDATEPPPPGQCRYLQPGVKQCSVAANGQGAFDVSTCLPAILYVRIDEPIRDFIPPDPRFFQVDRSGNAVVFIPIKERLPEVTSAVISTGTQTITLNIHRATRSTVDTQVTILDPHRVERDVQREQLRAELTRELTQQAEDAHRTATLDGLARAGVGVRQVHSAIARNDALIVLRVTQLVHVGSTRYLLFELQNRSSDPYDVRAVRLAAGRADVAAGWRLSSAVAPPAATITGAVELASAAPPAGKVQLRVDEVDPQRTVEVGNVELR